MGVVEVRKSFSELRELEDWENRLLTFVGVNWPKDLLAQPAQLVDAGFYYTGVGDKVRCAFCLGSLYDWGETDDPISEHRGFFPDCVFMKHHDDLMEYINYKHVAVIPSLKAKMRGPSTEESDLCVLRERVDELSSLLECKVCVNAGIDIVLMPCRHFVCCKSCLSRINVCPVCRKRIIASMAVYIA